MPDPAAKTAFPLGQRLVESRLITPEQLDFALKRHKVTGEFLGKILLDLGFVREEDLSLAFSSETEIPYQGNLTEILIDLDVIQLVSRDLCQRFKCIPLSLEDPTLTIAMADPYDVVALDAIGKELNSRYRINTVTADETDIIALIDRYYYEGATHLDGLIRDAKEQVRTRPIALKNLGEKAPVIRLVDQILFQGIKNQATDIHIEPAEKVVLIRYRVDGALFLSSTLPRELAAPIVSRIKIIADMDISENRLPQDGRAEFRYGSRVLDLRVSTFPTPFGENTVLRLLDRSKLLLGLNDLGYHPDHRALLEKMVKRPHGMVLVTGPTGSGKTTTLYAVLLTINSPEKNIMTVEDPIEYSLPFVRQSQVNHRAGYAFATGLKSILRQDPDVILVGELRDTETVEMALRSALTGHLTLSTLHTNDAASAIPRLIDMGVEPFLLSATLLGVVAQRLVRRICPVCREVYEPTEIEKRRLGIDGRSIKLYRGRGCKKCRNTGYQGRLAVAEILQVNEDIAGLILNHSSGLEIKEKAVSLGMRTMRQDAVSKVFKGITTLEEALRLT